MDPHTWRVLLPLGAMDSGLSNEPNAVRLRGAGGFGGGERRGGEFVCCRRDGYVCNCTAAARNEVLHVPDGGVVRVLVRFMGRVCDLHGKEAPSVEGLSLWPLLVAASRLTSIATTAESIGCTCSTAARSLLVLF